MRNLVVLNEHTVEFTKYPTFCTKGSERVKRLVTENEMAKIKKAVEAGDESEIENICYAIA